MVRWRRNPANIRLNRLVERLVAYEVRDAGVWRARCPAHRDRGQGLLIIAERSSLVDVVCRHGCSRAMILQAIGWPADALQSRRLRDRGTPQPSAAPVESGSPVVLGPVERAVLRVLEQAGRDGLPRDQLPARLWGWPSVSQWRRGHGAVWTYPQVDRDEYNRRQVSLTRALRSLARKGYVTKGEGGYWRRTDAGHRALNVPPPVTLNGMPESDQVFSTPPASDEAVDPVPLPSRRLDFSPPRQAPKTRYASGRRVVIDGPPQEDRADG